MRGLDPLIDEERQQDQPCVPPSIWKVIMDCRVKPGNDTVKLVCSNPELTPLAALVDVKEQMLERGPFFDQALIVRISDERLKNSTVVVREPVFPRIRAEDPFLFFPSIAIPSKWHNARVCHALHCDCFGFIEGLEQIDRKPWVLVDQRLSDTEHVHDRKNAGSLEISHFFGLVIRKQPRNARILRNKRLDEIGMKNRIEPA